MYGYSWNMMVHVWDTILVVIKVHDNVSNEDRYLDPKAWVQTDRWEKHGDMAKQYASCLRVRVFLINKFVSLMDIIVGDVFIRIPSK